jgi:hypothetical protein
MHARQQKLAQSMLAGKQASKQASKQAALRKRHAPQTKKT